jgi:hypothetical protein
MLEMTDTAAHVFFAAVSVYIETLKFRAVVPTVASQPLTKLCDFLPDK